MTNRNGVAQNVAPRTTAATQFAGVIRTMRLGRKMSDVSITALIAEARKAAKRADYYQSGEAWLWLRLADALEVAERDAQTAEDQANNLAGDVVQLEQKLAEAVTVPTENEREALSLIISNAVGGGNPNVRAITDVTDAVIAAGFRLPVPVEPETQRTRTMQANEIAYLVIDQAKIALPDFFVTLDFRYGIADALWDLGYRRSTPVEPEQITEGGTQ
jgi:hypothetical protein